MKLKDLFNQTINRSNNQISLNLKRRELKKKNIELKDVLDMEIKCEKMEFN